MKITAPFITKIALGAILAGSLFACNKTKTEDKPAAAAPSADANKEAIVFINQDSLLARYDYAKDVTKALQGKGKAAQSDVGSRQQALQREVADYQKNANTMPADQRQTTESRLQRENQDLQGYEQNATAQFQSEQSSEAGKVVDKIDAFVKGYAKQKGYKIVLSYSKANPAVMYGDPELDVTVDVVKGLNDAYAKEKK